MNRGKKGWEIAAICLLTIGLAGLPGFVSAADMGHGGMKGMKMEGSMEGHGAMKMGDKVFGGPIGPWQGEVRLMDMKAHVEKAKASGMKMEGMMKSHHVAVYLTDAKTKKPVHVTDGKGTVTVIGPDKKEEKADFMVMEGHFGADVNLPKAGKYGFKVSIGSGEKKGAAAFTHMLK